MKIFKIFRRHVIVSRFELDYIVSEYKRQRLINKHLYKNIINLTKKCDKLEKENKILKQIIANHNCKL